MEQTTKIKIEVGYLHLLTVKELQDTLWTCYLDKVIDYPVTKTEILPSGTPFVEFTDEGVEKVNNAIESYLQYLNDDNIMLGSSLEDLENFYDYALDRAFEPDCEPIEYDLPF